MTMKIKKKRVRKHLVSTRFSDEDVALLKQVAKANGTTMSDLIYQLAVDLLSKQTFEEERKVA